MRYNTNETMEKATTAPTDAITIDEVGSVEVVEDGLPFSELRVEDVSSGRNVLIEVDARPSVKTVEYVVESPSIVRVRTLGLGIGIDTDTDKHAKKEAVEVDEELVIAALLPQAGALVELEEVISDQAIFLQDNHSTCCSVN